MLHEKKTKNKKKNIQDQINNELQIGDIAVSFINDWTEGRVDPFLSRQALFWTYQALSTSKER